MKLAISLLLLLAPGFSAERPTWTQEEDWRNRIKAALHLGAPPPLEPEAHGSFEPVPGVVAECVSYGTQFGMRVPAILYRPKWSAGKIPGLIVVNGHGGDKYSWYAFYSGILYARAGAAVLTYDPAGEGERNIARKSGTRAHDKVEPPDELAQRLGGLMMTDIVQAVSYLSRRPDVDPRRLGAFGYSMGSFVLSITAGVERRLKTCVLVGGGNLDGPGEYWDKSKPMCQGIPYRSLLFLGDRPAAIYALHASRGPTLVFNGLEDTTVQIPKFGEAGFKDLQQRVAALRGSAEGVFETGFVPDAAHRPYFVTKPVALWLEKHLDFPNWTEEGIRAMPETHISEWARTNGVAMDPLYSNEQREGGTRALGEGVPNLSRADLSVFSPEEWERRKDRLIYETWLKEAKARIARNAAPLEGLKSSHPRLLLLDGELPRIRSLIREDPLAHKIYDRLVHDARGMMSAPPATYELTHGRLIYVSRRTIERIYTLALLYRLDGNKEYLDRAIAELRAVAAFPDWHQNFLDKAEMIHAAAMGYDWLYNSLSPEDRRVTRKAIVEKGLRHALPIYEEQRAWAINRFNWNPVCNGGVGLGALAVADEEPELAQTILRHILRSFPLALSSYRPDGAWAEGPEYWHYTTRYAVHLLAAMHTALGHDFGLSAAEGFESTGRFRIHALGPSGKLYNFADADETPERASEMFWLARRFREPVYAAHQRRFLEHPSALDLTWFEPDQTTPDVARWPLNSYFRETEVAVMRSSWEDPDAIFVAVKGGQNRGGRGHAQLDLGSFVLDAGGTRWALDFGRNNYQVPNYFGSLRFTYYRTRTESHNTVLIDGANQDVMAEAPVFAHRFEPDLAFVRIDLAKTYPGKLRRFERGVALHGRKHVIVQDEISAAHPVEALWGMVTGAEVRLYGAQAELRRGGWALRVSILSPPGARFDTVSTQVAPPQDHNGDTCKLVVRLPGKITDIRLTVALTPHRAEQTPPQLTWQDRPLERW